MTRASKGVSFGVAARSGDAPNRRSSGGRTGARFAYFIMLPVCGSGARGGQTHCRRLEDSTFFFD
jgi:hypothetical protein